MAGCYAGRPGWVNRSAYLVGADLVLAPAGVGLGTVDPGHLATTPKLADA